MTKFAQKAVEKVETDREEDFLRLSCPKRDSGSLNFRPDLVPF